MILQVTLATLMMTAVNLTSVRARTSWRLRTATRISTIKKKKNHQQHHQAQQHFIPPNPRDVPPNDAAAAAAAQRKAQAAEDAKQGTFPGCDGGRYRTRFDRSKVDFDETCAFDVNRLRKLYMDILHLKTQYPGASQGLVAGLLDILHNWTVSKESEGGRVATSFCA
jgi:hypothetical protein